MGALARTDVRSDDERGLGVRIRGARRAFADGTVAFDALDLDVAPGAFLALVGPSGCGKSTLLRLVAGLDAAEAGTVELDGKDPRIVPPPAGDASDRWPVAFVFQDAHLLPWRDVLDNVALPLQLRGVAGAARRERAHEALALVGLAEAAGKRPAELSGGMRMRASLARALVARPRLLLLDEPFGALDELTRQHLDDELRALWRASGATVLFVTHSITEAAYLAERVVVFSPRPARVVLDTPVDLPGDRVPALRTEPVFASVVRRLSTALDDREP